MPARRAQTAAVTDAAIRVVSWAGTTFLQAIQLGSRQNASHPPGHRVLNDLRARLGTSFRHYAMQSSPCVPASGTGGGRGRWGPNLRFRDGTESRVRAGAAQASEGILSRLARRGEPHEFGPERCGDRVTRAPRLRYSAARGRAEPRATPPRWSPASRAGVRPPAASHWLHGARGRVGPR
jgi:hypothetical protein